MKRIWTSAAVAAVVAAGLVLAGCGGGEQYGAAPSGRELTPVADIVADPTGFEGREVTISGTIDRECPTGCWFDLREGSVVVHVDLAPSGLAIPQHVGKTALVDGRVTLRDGRAMVHAEGVVIR